MPRRKRLGKALLVITWVLAAIVLALLLCASNVSISNYFPSLSAALGDPVITSIITLMALAALTSAIWLLLSRGTLSRMALVSICTLDFADCLLYLSLMQFVLLQVFLVLFVFMQTVAFLILVKVKGYRRTLDDLTAAIRGGYPIYAGSILISVVIIGTLLAQFLFAASIYAILLWGALALIFVIGIIMTVNILGRRGHSDK